MDRLKDFQRVQFMTLLAQEMVSYYKLVSVQVWKNVLNVMTGLKK